MRCRLPATCIALLCLAASAAGQGEVRDFRLTAGRNPQLGSDNPAWLSTLGQGSLSTAGTVFIKEDGGLVPLESSPDNWTAGISTESFTRISEKLSFHGKMKYSFLNELGSGGQILMSPKDNPVNFLEEDLSTAGRRKKESYSLGGALCWSFSDRLSAAAAFDYTTADRTKFRDPRFADVLMDLTLAPGVTLRLSESFTLGAGFFWRHSLEQLSANLFGTKDRDYDILVDQGAFYGFKEDFDGDQGYVSLSNARPLTDNLYGFSVQTLSGKRVRLYNELRGAWRNGFYGSRTSSSVVFCEFHGPEARYDGCLQAGSGQDRHIFRLGAGAKMLSNFTNSYKYNVVPGMTTTIEYTGQNRTLNRTDIDARLSYSLQK
ncbi:MAG: hypothetical protein IJ799_02700, partial [Bacteroidales bacterium]|nr:hypothetical protein [Bacteroidales bacterium]